MHPRAGKLGVSVKTVSGDWRKLHGYIERLKWQEQQEFNEKITTVLDQNLAKVPTGMRFRLVASLWGADKRTKNRAFDALLVGDLAVLKSIIVRTRKRGM